jgi:hypothetical protein
VHLTPRHVPHGIDDQVETAPTVGLQFDQVEHPAAS